MASSRWMGYVSYSGPWGQSLNISQTRTLTFTRLSGSKYYLKVETSSNGTSDNWYASIACSSPSFVSQTFAGISIKYYTNTGLLKFGSASDLSQVLDSLDARYKSYNLNYENQYSTFTREHLDSPDIVNSFDEFLPMRQFEALFSGFASKRSQLESKKNSWLANNLTGTDPDDIDQTYDDLENTISNTNYKVIIGTSTYSFCDDGLQSYSVTAPPVSNRNSCGTNRRNSTTFTTMDEARKFKIKVALNTWYVRSGAKGKVVSFKKKNNDSKRARMKLLVVCGGTVYQTEYCGNNFSFQDQNPAPSGYRNRKSLKVARHQPGSNWRTKTAELGSSFDAQNTLEGGVSIN